MRLRREGASNTEWIETGLKVDLFADACAMIEELLNDPQVAVAGASKLPGEKRGGFQGKVVVSMFGPVHIQREYYYHPERGCRRYSLDEALGLENGYTPAVVRIMCRAGARDTYTESSADLRSLGERLSLALKEALDSKINYFENNKSRMLYGTYRAKGYFYGSGVIEAGCKAVIGKRAKQSGMFWSEKGAEDVLAIRTALYSDRFDQFWDDRNAA